LARIGGRRPLHPRSRLPPRHLVSRHRPSRPTAGALTLFDAWAALLLYWIVPYCTWHMAVQYVRIICEHSAVQSDEEEYSITRTTTPTWLICLTASCNDEQTRSEL